MVYLELHGGHFELYGRNHLYVCIQATVCLQGCKLKSWTVRIKVVFLLFGILNTQVAVEIVEIFSDSEEQPKLIYKNANK